MKKKNSNLEAARTRMYHDLIFECAERVFAEKGFDESTMQDVASEAGISLKTLYATFPGQDRDLGRDPGGARGGLPRAGAQQRK
jgi:AcrR family transcriptional regulator